MRNRIVSSLALVVVSSLTSGCGLLMEAVIAGVSSPSSSSSSSGDGRHAGEDKLEVAYKARDLPTLQKYCSGALPSGEAVKQTACTEAITIEGEDTKDCSKVVDLYEKGPLTDRDHVVAMGKQFARCELDEPLFERVGHWGEDDSILVEIEKSGAPLESLFVKYASTHADATFLNIEHDTYAMDHISHWLTDQGHKGQCRLLASVVDGAAETVRRNALSYFRSSGCKEGVAIAVALLTSDVASSRYAACVTLGELGDASVMNKLAVLGDTDGWSEIQEQGDYATRVYPVRDVCRAAAGKIAIRAR